MKKFSKLSSQARTSSMDPKHNGTRNESLTTKRVNVQVSNRGSNGI